MIETIAWMRPAWLLALPVGLVIGWAWWRTRSGDRLWRAHVDPELLAHLLSRSPGTSARLAFVAAAVALALVCVALAGPVWRAQPVFQQRDSGARIVVLDLSASMDAIDVAPTRLARARQAAAALLREADGAQLGLVVFGADAFTVAPMTSDAAVLLHLLPGVSTGTIPRSGSRPDLALELALSLLKRSNANAGEVILVGDSAGDARTLEAARMLASAGFSLSVLAVGTAQGGPVPIHTGAFAKTEAGEVFLAKADIAGLEALARSGGGRFQLLTARGELPRFAMRALASVERAATGPQTAPVELGAWLVLLALPFAAFLFRRGWLACYAAFALALPSPHAEAFDWSDLWRRPDQQAATAFRNARAADYERLAQKLGADSPWHAMLLYRSGRFAEAASQFSAQDSSAAHYNRGNALALDGDLESAIAAYDAALARNPGMQDALANRALVRELLARRPPSEPDAGAPEQQGKRNARSSSSTRSDGSDHAAGEAAEQRRQAEHERMLRGGRRTPAKPRPEDGGEDFGTAAQDSSSDESRRLEGLLGKVGDDAGSLLANRFARQLQLRGTPHRDTGAKW